jgi:hypothetical protein
MLITARRWFRFGKIRSGGRVPGLTMRNESSPAGLFFTRLVRLRLG